MNCRHAQDRLLADRDATRDDATARALADHLANCSSCRALQTQLAAARTAWQETTDRVAIPDARHEWHAVRRRLRTQGTPSRSDRRHRLRTWLRVATPLAAAAMMVLIFWQRPAPSLPATTAPTTEAQTAVIASAEFVETENEDATPFVYVDAESGWLIVWASAPPDAASI